MLTIGVQRDYHFAAYLRGTAKAAVQRCVIAAVGGVAYHQGAGITGQPCSGVGGTIVHHDALALALRGLHHLGDGGGLVQRRDHDGYSTSVHRRCSPAAMDRRVVRPTSSDRR